MNSTQKHIYIHICSTNGQFTAETTTVLLGLQQICNNNNILCTINISNIPKSYWNARNNALKDFKENDNFTHLLLINDKISVDPKILIHLLNSEYDVSGIIAPMGIIRWPNLLHKKNLTAINTILQDTSSDTNNLKEFWTWIHSNINMYNVIFNKDTQLNEKGWINVDSVATDFLLLTRNIVQKLPQNTFKYNDDSILIDQSFNDTLKELKQPIYIWPNATVSKNTSHPFIGKINDVMSNEFKLIVKPKIQEINDTDEYQPPID